MERRGGGETVERRGEGIVPALCKRYQAHGYIELCLVDASGLGGVAFVPNLLKVGVQQMLREGTAEREGGITARSWAFWREDFARNPAATLPWILPSPPASLGGCVLGAEMFREGRAPLCGYNCGAQEASLAC